MIKRTTKAPLMRIVMTCTAVLLLFGCAARDPVAGDLESGSIADVAEKSEGMGSMAGSQLPVASIGVIPIEEGAHPSIPLRYEEQIATLWFFSSEMVQEDAIRDGFWAHLKVREGEWGKRRAIYRDRLNLKQLNNMSIDKDGRVVVTRPEMVDPALTQNLNKVAAGLVGKGKSLPWVDGAERTVSRTTVVNTADGTIHSSIRPISGSQPPDISASISEVQKVIEQARKATNSLNQSPQSNAVNEGLSTVPPTLPGKQTTK